MVHSNFHEAKSEGPLYALFLNCTLKKSPETSNTEALCNLLVDRLKAHEPDIETEIVRVVDYNVLPGISNDEGEGDEWPMILEKVKRCNIFVPAMPIWMGVRSSVMQRVIERLDGTTKTVMCEKTGQFPLYGSVCGCVVRPKLAPVSRIGPILIAYQLRMPLARRKRHDYDQSVSINGAPFRPWQQRPQS